jgi:hypothetical protein
MCESAYAWFCAAAAERAAIVSRGNIGAAAAPQSHIFLATRLGDPNRVSPSVEARSGERERVTPKRVAR